MMTKPYRKNIPCRAAKAAAAILLGVLAAAAAQEVRLPLEDYEALRDRTRIPEHAEQDPPAPVAFEEAVLRIDIGEASAIVTQTLTIAVLADGWQRLPIAAAGSLTETRFGTLDARIDDQKGEPELVVRGKGRHRIELVSALPLERQAHAAVETWLLSLPTPPAAMVHGSVALPSSLETVRVELGGALAPATSSGPAHRFVATGGDTLGLVLEGPAVAPASSALPLRFAADTAVALTAGRDRLHAHAILLLELRQGELDAFTVPLPPGFDVLDVDLGARAGWDVTDGRLRVIPAVPVRDRVRADIRLAAAPTDTFAAPVLTPEGADGSRTVVRARAEADGLLELTAEGGRSPESAEERELVALLGPGPGRPLVIPKGGRPPRYAVTWAAETEVLSAQVDRLLVDLIVSDSGQAIYRTWIEARNTGAKDISIVLPGTATLITARRDGAPTTPGQRDEAWTLPLAARSGSQVLEIEARIELPPLDGATRYTLPLPTLSIPATRVEARLLLPAGRRYRLHDLARLGTVRPPPHVKPLDAPSALAAQLGLAGTSDETVRGGWLPSPAGWWEIEAGWSALVARPAAISLEIEALRSRREWF